MNAYVGALHSYTKENPLGMKNLSRIRGEGGSAILSAAFLILLHHWSVISDLQDALPLSVFRRLQLCQRELSQTTFGDEPWAHRLQAFVSRY